MEQVLDQYLEDDFKYLGIPYWHWSSHDSQTYTHDDDNTYPIFPDFWQDIKVAYKNPEHSSYDASFANDPDEDSGWGVHCTSDRSLDTIARAKVDTLVQKRLAPNALTVQYLDATIQEAMRRDNIEDFGSRLSNAHNPIHYGFGCRMGNLGMKKCRTCSDTGSFGIKFL